MIAFLLILAGAIAAVLVGLALRLPSLVSTLLASYLAWVVDLGLVTLVLSPFREVDRGGLGGRRGGHPGRCVRCLVASRPTCPVIRAGADGPRGGRVEPVDAPLPDRGRGAARLRACARADDAVEQLGRLHLPPGPRRGLGTSRRPLLDPGRADRSVERVPAARRAADPVPLRRPRRGSALRGAAVPGGARDPGGRLRLLSPAGLRRPSVRVGGVPPGDVLAFRPRVVDRAERPGRGVVPRDRSVLPAVGRSGRGRSRRRGDEPRARREADHGRRLAGARLARRCTRPPHGLANAGGRGGGAVGDRLLELRAQPGADRPCARPRRRPGRVHDVAVLSRVVRDAVLDALHADGHLEALAAPDRVC